MLHLASADGDYFCDALDEIYSTFKATGAKMVGHWPAEGYKHEDSKARSCCSKLGTLLLPIAGLIQQGSSEASTCMQCSIDSLDAPAAGPA